MQRSLAGYYRENGKYSEAIAALKSIRNPKPDVMAEIAYTYQLGGKLDDSAKLYSQAANAVPKGSGVAGFRGTGRDRGWLHRGRRTHS